MIYYGEKNFTKTFLQKKSSRNQFKLKINDSYKKEENIQGAMNLLMMKIW